MNELFFITLAFAIGSIAFVLTQTVIIVKLVSWNRELEEENARLQPPF